MNIEPALARALLAGLVTGVACALLATTLGLWAMARSPEWRARWAQLRVSPMIVGVVLVNGGMLAWTAIGLVPGAIYYRATTHAAGSGLFSPNLRFTLVVLMSVGLALAMLLGWRRGVGRWALTVALIAALGFGWALPLLASSG